MINQLILENFRQHESLTIDFERGLVAIRGRNEAGKTTIQEAIGYAWFGADALRQAFEKVVTWGKPESALKVTMLFTIDGVQYTIWRKKSGAELSAPGVLVTGQKETRAYIERLFGVNAKTAAELMFASQNQLRGALEENGKAVELISKLANFDLIDRVVALVQAKLPTGATKTVEERVKTLREQLDAHKVAPLDVSELEAAAATVNTDLGAKFAVQQELNVAAKDIDVVGARQLIGDAATARARLESLDTQLTQARAAAAVVVTPPTATQADIDGWRAAMVAAKASVGALTAWQAVKALKPPEAVWEGDRKSFDAELARLQAEMSASTLRYNAAYLEHAEAVSRQVHEKTCGLCGKDISEVPEVVERNSTLGMKAEAAKAVMAQMEVAQSALADDLNAMNELHTAAQTYERQLQRYNAYLDLLDTQVPMDWRWKGEPPVQVKDLPDYDSLIRAAETALQAFNRAQGSKDAAQELATRLEAQHAAAAVALAAAEGKLPAAREKLKQAEMLEGRVRELSAEIAGLQSKAGQIAQDIAHRTAMHAQLVTTHGMLQTQANQAEEELKGMNRNNALLAKLRQARPQIADKLWGIVLSSVGNYFSQTRGVQSCVSRESSQFMIDGHEVASYSGSTIDSLGLALRKALTKTFFPAMPMMMLDEPAHGMDAEREANMLGAIVASGFDQVVLITHSAQSDAFANQVVQL